MSEAPLCGGTIRHAGIGLMPEFGRPALPRDVLLPERRAHFPQADGERSIFSTGGSHLGELDFWGESEWASSHTRGHLAAGKRGPFFTGGRGEGHIFYRG